MLIRHLRAATTSSVKLPVTIHNVYVNGPPLGITWRDAVTKPDVFLYSYILNAPQQI
jgi:hypothetical protein